MLRVIPGPCDFINRHTATPYMVFERSREESYFILASQSGYRINAFWNKLTGRLRLSLTADKPIDM